jgi:hypothetical protein
MKLFWAVPLTVLALALGGCDSSEPIKNPPPPPPAAEVTEVRVTSSVSQLLQADKATLDATVLGTGTFDAAVNWTLQGGGSLLATTGARVIYTAPDTLSADATVTVTATSASNPGKSGSATLALKVPRITRINLSTADNTLFAQETTTLQAQLTGLGQFQRSLNWTVTGGGTLSATTGENVVYTAPAGVNADTQVTVTAASAKHPETTASLTLTLQAPTISQVVVSPASVAALFAKEVVTLEATVSGAGPFSSEVNWTVTGGGRLSATTGARVVYTAPDTVDEERSVTVTATSVQAPARGASTAISLKKPRVTGVEVTAPTSELYGQETVTLEATVTGNGAFNPALTWSLQGAGSLSSTTGASIVYTAPATITTDTEVTVTAASVSDPTKTAPYTLTLRPPTITEVTVNPASVEELFEKGTVTLEATVTGGGPFNPAVTWTVTGGGTLSATTGASVTYTAPDSVSEDKTVTVTVSSVQTPARGASATLSLKRPRVTSVEVTAPASELYAQETVTLEATVSGGGAFNPALTWSLQGAGSLSATTGASVVYTAPASVAADTEVTVTAASVSDPTVTAPYTLTLKAPVITDLQVSVDRNQLFAGNAVIVSATVSGAGPFSPEVDWTVVSGGGSLEPLPVDPQSPELRSARYLAPFASAPVSATVRATARADVTMAGELSVQVVPVPLTITEVSSATVSNWPGWLELHNPTAAPIELSAYALRAQSADTTNDQLQGIKTFALPSRTLAPGAYIVVAGKYSNFVNYDSDQLVWLVEEPTTAPLWSGDTFIELVHGDTNETVDFVRFGNSTEAPQTPGAWRGSTNAPAVPTTGSESFSFVRGTGATDTNSAGDWSSRAFATAAGPNDVPADAVDGDSDGIPDSAEVEGGRFAGLDLYAMGARADQRDLFIEVDHMQSSDLGIVPQKEALENMVQAFDRRGIQVHLDVGTLFSASFDPENYNLGQGSAVLPYTPSLNLNNRAGEASSLYQLKSAHMDLRRRAIFHYCIFGSSQNLDGTPGSSGRAEIVGNDLVVTLGEWGLNRDTEDATNQLINYQSSTLMHELGHNLGLRHGGNVNTNYKPNYLSIMNYLYQLSGLGPISGDAAGDRYFYTWRLNGYTSRRDLEDSPFTTGFVMDYSDGTSSSINEAAVDEAAGLGRPDATSVDYDANGTVDTPRLDVNRDNAFQTLTDHNDWANIVLPFSLTHSATNGSSLLSNTAPVRLSVVRDQQPLSDEEPPPPAFFEELRRTRSAR